MKILSRIIRESKASCKADTGTGIDRQFLALRNRTSINLCTISRIITINKLILAVIHEITMEFRDLRMTHSYRKSLAPADRQEIHLELTLQLVQRNLKNNASMRVSVTGNISNAPSRISLKRLDTLCLQRVIILRKRTMTHQETNACMSFSKMLCIKMLCLFLIKLQRHLIQRLNRLTHDIPPQIPKKPELYKIFYILSYISRVFTESLKLSGLSFIILISNLYLLHHFKTSLISFSEVKR